MIWIGSKILVRLTDDDFHSLSSRQTRYNWYVKSQRLLSAMFCCDDWSTRVVINRKQYVPLRRGLARRVPYRAGYRATKDIPKIQPSCWEENKGRGKLLNAIVRFRVFLP